MPSPCPGIRLYAGLGAVHSPSLGLSPLIRQQLAETIKGIHRDGVTIILVEQNARPSL